MSIEGQGHFFTIYFPGFVLYWARISGERLQDYWSSGYYMFVGNLGSLLYGDVSVMKALLSYMATEQLLCLCFSICIHQVFS